MGAAVRGADLGDRGRAAGRAASPLDVALSRLALARPRGAAHAPPRRSPRRSRRACARARSCSTRCSSTRRPTTACAATRNWLAARNLANEASDESVQALIEAVRGRYELARRWYRLKARLLGIERLADYDRMAAVDAGRGDASPTRRRASSCSTATAPSRPSSARSPGASSTSAGSTRPCARPSAAARSAPSAVPSVHPYVLLNYTARRRDVLTLAHELGHGVHFALAARQGIFHQGTPLTLAETASVFGETIVFGRLLGEDSHAGLAPGAARREPRGHDRDRLPPGRDEPLRGARRTPARREQGELSVERFGELWAQSQAELLGDSVEITDGLPQLVVLHPALHRHPRLRLRVRLRPAARAVGLRALRAAGPGVRAALPRAARRGRLAQPRGARARSSASTSPTPASGTRASTSSSASWRTPKRRRGRCRATAGALGRRLVARERAETAMTERCCYRSERPVDRTV